MMAGYNRRSDSSGEKRFSKFGDRPRRERADGPSRFGSHDRLNRMHSVVCDSCGETCEVPFKPTGSKPVQCRNCFRKGNSTSFRSSVAQAKEANGSNAAVSSAQLQEINAKLDKIMKFLKME